MDILAGMQSRVSSFRVAVIGAGMAGASCAHGLAAAGCAVTIVDKARGPGGRLATRRLEWSDASGLRRTVRLDHGAPAFTARSDEFQSFLARELQPGTLTAWAAALAPGSRPLEDEGPLCLPLPDMPALCRGLIADLPRVWSFAVDRLVRHPLGWQVQAAGSSLAGHFDAVVLAMPPAQAATLLAPLRADWAQRASLALMQPCWTLMGVSRHPSGRPSWAVGRPDQGPLAWVMRNDARPGRESEPDEAHWVVHARAGWSRRHLDQPAEWVQAELQSALHDWLGEPLDWAHAVVHRWRYAMPQVSSAGPARHGWWDVARGLGVCGDFLGGCGVEGAWQSAQALVEAMQQGIPESPFADTAHLRAAI
jgi:renalase